MRPPYIGLVLGRELSPGDVIIANQTYAKILYIDYDLSRIVTESGSRLYSPSHHYPVFSIP